MGRHRAPLGPRPVLTSIWAGVAAACLGGGVFAVVPHASDWTAPAPARVAVQPATDQPAVRVAAATSTLPRSRPVSVAIPALDVRTSLVRLGLAADGSMQTPVGASAAGWYDLGPTPGELGPAVLAGHVDWAGSAGAFAQLHALHRGDEIDVARADGTTAVFRVDRVKQYAKEAFPTEAVFGDLDVAGLRLITCGGSFDEAAQSYRDNVVVFATLSAAGHA